jgi:hypothetical protein
VTRAGVYDGIEKDSTYVSVARHQAASEAAADLLIAVGGSVTSRPARWRSSWRNRRPFQP